MNLDSLHDDILARLRTASERPADFDAAKREVVRKKWTLAPNCYDVEKYEPKGFRPGGRMLAAKPEGASFEFGFDAQDRPRTMTHSNSATHSRWTAFYGYAEGLVERVECMGKIPWSVQRLVLDGDERRSYQAVRLNGSPEGRRTAGMTGSEVVDDMQRDGRLLETVKIYHWENGSLTSADGLIDMFGLGIQRFRDEYAYEGGKLAKITCVWGRGGVKPLRVPGEREVIFVSSRGKTSRKALSEELSVRFADSVVDALSRVDSAARLVSVELSYRSGVNWVPVVIPCTSADRTAIVGRDPSHVFRLVLGISDDRWLTLDPAPFEEPLLQFVGGSGSDDDGRAGEAMLRNAAKKVTARLGADRDFICYAIDHELDGDEFRRVLKSCGASSEQLSKWKKQRWL